MLSKEAIEKFEELGVPAHSGGIYSIHFVLLKKENPRCAIFLGSAEPSLEEIAIFSKRLPEIIEFFKTDQTELDGVQYNTITFKKNDDGTWTFRRLAWPPEFLTWFPKWVTLDEAWDLAIKKKQAAT